MKFLYKILYYMAILLIFIIVTSLTAVYVFAGNEITWDLSLVLAFLFVPVILVLCLICHFSLTSLSEMPFNNQYYKRVLSVNSVVDLKKMEQDFQITRKVYKFLRKIQPHKSAANIFQTYASYQAQQSKNNSSKSTMSKKEKLPPLSVK